MQALIPISLIGWLPIVLLMFLLLPPRRAVVVAFIGAWLFLPVPVPESLKIPGLPDLDKMTVTCVAVLMGALLFDNKRFLSLRWHWYDLPILIWCLCPLASSLANTGPADFHPGIGNPIYDGLAEALKQSVTWGLPYIIGRMYFTSLAALRELAVGIFIGGLVYIPLCLIEMKISPQLHNIVYGQHPHDDFRQTMRDGFWRPTVFMAHGLMVSLWMGSATLIGAWLWFSGSMRRLWGVHTLALVVALFTITVLSRSMASLMLMCVGLGALYVASTQKMRWPIIALIAIAPLYMGLRATGAWDGMNLVNLITAVSGEDRAQSLETRFVNENLLTEKAFEQPVFGWAGWGRSRVYDRHGKDISITDGQWIIALGKNGVVGLASLTLAILLPVWLTLRRYPIRYWSHPKVAPAAAMAVVLTIYMVDNLLNAMINPVFMLIAGALTTQKRPALRARRGRRPTRPNQDNTTQEPPTQNDRTHAAAVEAG